MYRLLWTANHAVLLNLSMLLDLVMPVYNILMVAV